MKDKVVVITGASSGIGAALAQAMGQAGAKVVLAARRVEEMKRVAMTIPKAVMVVTDVTKDEDCKNLIDITIKEYGRIDILVNNAGISMTTLFEDITDLSLFRKIMDVNYHGSVACTYYALPHLKASKGLIVAVSSLTGKTGVPSRTAYSASKHAMQGFFDSLRVELMETGVDVTVISPGFVQSEVRYKALGGDAEPRNESHIDESNVMTAEECAAQMMDAIRERNRDVIIADSLRSQLLPWLRLIAPEQVDKVAYESIKKGTT